MRPYKTPRLKAGTLAAIAIPALLAAAIGAEAQQTALEEIIVQAPIAIERRLEAGPADPTSRTETVELKRGVYTGDLDLTKHGDVEKLDTRIREVAQESCGMLAEMFRLGDTGSRDRMRCVEQAVKSASEARQRAIAAAN